MFYCLYIFQIRIKLTDAHDELKNQATFAFRLTQNQLKKYVKKKVFILLHIADDEWI